MIENKYKNKKFIKSDSEEVITYEEKAFHTTNISGADQRDVRTDQGHSGHAGHWDLGLCSRGAPGEINKQRTATTLKQEE